MLCTWKLTIIVNRWITLMEILKKIGIDWRERRLISKLYVHQSVKVRLDQGVRKSVKTGTGVRQGCCLSPLLFNLYSEHVTQEALEALGDFKVGGKIISTVRFADDLVLLAKEETILQSMIDKLIEVGRGYGIESNVEKTKTMRISRQSPPLHIKIDKKPVENVEEFNYLGSMITNDARVHEKLRPGLPWQKQHSTRRRLYSPAN
jgi:hypothetical protein